MGTLHSIHQGTSIHHGTISAKPLGHAESGRICDRDRFSGRSVHGAEGLSGQDHRNVHGYHTIQGGGLEGEGGESAQNLAMAEIGNLISSLSSLSSQAQGLPLSPPTLPGLPQGQGYQPQPVDYAFGDDAN